MGKKSVQKKDLLILGCIILIALVLRLYKIGAPLSDFHSWRQADTAAVARNFVREKFDIFEPHYDDQIITHQELLYHENLRDACTAGIRADCFLWHTVPAVYYRAVYKI